MYECSQQSRGLIETNVFRLFSGNGWVVLHYKLGYKETPFRRKDWFPSVQRHVASWPPAPLQHGTAGIEQHFSAGVRQMGPLGTRV